MIIVTTEVVVHVKTEAAVASDREAMQIADAAIRQKYPDLLTANHILLETVEEAEAAK